MLGSMFLRPSKNRKESWTVTYSDPNPNTGFHDITVPTDFSPGFMFLGSFEDLPKQGKPGDIIYCPATDDNYVWIGDKWEPLGKPSEEKSAPRINRKIVARCSSCGGNIKDLTDEDIDRGFVKCGYCGCMINLFEFEETKD